MCEPVSASTALMLLSAGSAAVTGVAARGQARDQRRALTRQRDAQAEEIRTSKSLEAGQRVKAARAERARLRVAAGEAGISGVSFEEELYQSFFDEDFDLGALAKDAEFAQRASEATYQGNMARSRGPSALEIGLNVAGAGYQGHSAGLQIINAKKRPPPNAT